MLTSTAARLALTFSRSMHMKAKPGMPNGIPFKRHRGQIKLRVTLGQRLLAAVLGKWGTESILLHSTQPGI
ncbi:hypothetical protein AEQ67_21670 [Pseudomonas sp. RIT-PI-q]|nr:hypothetical protein AEQ67_21670 [Pseudomonas sp. RIT-PI-q]